MAMADTAPKGGKKSDAPHHQHSDEHAREGRHRADGEINATGEDYEYLADSQQPNRGHKAHHDGQVGRLEENVGFLRPEEQTQHEKDGNDARHAEL